VHRLWPDPDPSELDDTALISLYAPDRQRPSLRANFVASLDGAATLDGRSDGLSGPADKRLFALLRMACDALLVGAGTLRQEQYRAVRLDPGRRAWRRDHGLPEYPPLIVVSRRLALDPAHPALTGAPVRPIVLTCDASPAGSRASLAEVAEILICGEAEVDLAAALAQLHRRGLDQILSEGGPHLLGSLTAADLVDELCLTVSPLLAGPGAGRITAGAPSPQPHRLPLVHVLTADGALFLRYAR
jgi:riboflavin biosynthesis pyrimidine reductase